MEGKGRWSAQAKGGAGCSTASTEVSANITVNSEVGKDFQSYPKLGLGGQTFVSPQSAVIGCGLPQEGSGISGEVALFS